MFVDVHAIVILTTVVVSVVIVVCNHSWRPRPLQKAIAPVLAIAGVGVLCICLLSVFGVPIAEWVFPGIGAFLVGFFMKSPRASKTISWGLFIVAVGLCVNSCLLRSNGYTSAPERTRAMYGALEQAFMKSLSGQLRKTFPADEVLAQGPLDGILPGPDRRTDWDRKTLRRLWHTWFTGLHEITTVPGEIWYPGGSVAVGSGKLLWKTKDQTGGNEKRDKAP